MLLRISQSPKFINTFRRSTALKKNIQRNYEHQHSILKYAYRYPIQKTRLYCIPIQENAKENPNHSVFEGIHAEDLEQAPSKEEELIQIEESIKKDPTNIALWFTKANLFYDLKKYQYAIDSCFATMNLVDSSKLTRQLSRDYYIKILSLKIKTYKMMGTRENLRSSLSYLDKLLTVSPGFYPALIEKCEILIQLKQYAEAIDFLDHLTKGDYKIPFLKGCIYKKKGIYEKALECFNTALKLSNEFEIHLEKITCLSNIGDHQQCFELVKKLLEDFPKKEQRFQILLNFSNVFFENGDYDLALEQLEQAKTLKIRASEIWLKIYHIYNEKGDSLKRSDACDHYINSYLIENNINTKSQEIFADIGDDFFHREKFDEALIWYFASLEFASSFQIIMKVSITLHRQGLYEQALVLARQSIGIQSRKKNHLISLGDSMHYAELKQITGDIEGALHIFLELIKRFPEDINVAQQIIKCYLQTRNITKVEEFLISLHPKLKEHPLILIQKGWLKLSKGVHGEAVEYFTRALELEKSEDVITSVSYALWHIGSYEESNKLLNYLPLQAWNNPQNWFIRTDVLLEEGKHDEATYAFKKGMQAYSFMETRTEQLDYFVNRLEKKFQSLKK